MPGPGALRQGLPRGAQRACTPPDEACPLAGDAGVLRECAAAAPAKLQRQGVLHARILSQCAPTIQPPARGDHPHTAPVRDGRGGDGHQVASLKLGKAAEARLCTEYGTLSVVSAWGTADHRRHHAGRGDPEDPPASEARSRPAPDCSGACPPGSLRLVLRLTAPCASPTRLRLLPWGGTTPPSPTPPDVSPHTARGWGDPAVRRQRLPSAPC
jgi:hypothetical protein